MELKTLAQLPLAQRRIIRAWCMYDWANSGYATSALAAFFPIYFVVLFRDALGEEAVLWGFSFTGSSALGLAVAVSTALVAITSPILGVIADRVPIKKTLLWVYTIAGSFFVILSFFSAYTSQPWAWLLGTFILGNIGFAGSLVFYNAFLPHVAPRNLLDDISSRGYAYGYVGGGLLLLLHVIVLAATAHTDFTDLVMRLSLASTGIWWFGWGIWTLKVVPEPQILDTGQKITVRNATGIAFRELARTFKEISKFKVIVVYLIAFLLFNDGIQTVMGIASAFAVDTLRVNQVFIVSSLLLIQFVAAIAAMAFIPLARILTTKGALNVALFGWILIVILGVAIVRLTPDDHAEFDYQLAYDRVSEMYLVDKVPAETSSQTDRFWRKEIGEISDIDVLDVNAASKLLASVGNSPYGLYSISISGGPLSGKTSLGILHPANLGSGTIDWWPKLVREKLWAPLGLTAEFQWLILGVCVGFVMGGSQALARSLFAQLTPETRSAEFFSFFGFVSRASTVFGPMLYVAVTGVFDTRLAVVSILVIIISGTVILKWVNVSEGIRAAAREDHRQRQLETAANKT